MSLNIYADIREIFAELTLNTPNGEFLFIRSSNRKDQMLLGLKDCFLKAKEILNTDNFSQYTFNYRSDKAETLLKEHWLSPIGLITTEGFQNILEVQNQNRSELFSLKAQKQRPLIHKDFCFGISERVNAQGSIEKPLQTNEISVIAEKLQLLNLKEVVVTFNHSKLNPSHEKLLQKELQKHDINTYCSHFESGNEYERTINTIKTIVELKAAKAMGEILAGFGLSNEQIKKTTHAKNLIQVFENKIICNDFCLPLSPLSKVVVDSSGIPIIIYNNVQSEPGPVAFGKGVEITCLDVLFYKHQLQYSDSLKRIKIDLPRIKKYLLLLAQQMRTDLDTAVDRFLFLFHELVNNELNEFINPEIEITGELSEYVLPKHKEKIKNKAYVTQIGGLVK
ncbi:MAG: hypothetical protein IPM57_02730 [Oligoflexia bacterium]|nr:hypothetical protein [Oligoflexia bacterium]